MHMLVILRIAAHATRLDLISPPLAQTCLNLAMRLDLLSHAQAVSPLLEVAQPCLGWPVRIAGHFSVPCLVRSLA